MTRWYERLLLRMLPAAYREKFGDDLCRDWRALRHTVRRQGRGAHFGYVLREARAFLQLIWDTRTGTQPAAAFVSALRLDGRAAWRRVTQRPTQVLASGLMLAAAFTAVLVSFTVAAAMLWRPLPFRDPDRLVAIWEHVGALTERDPARVTGSRFVHWTAGATGFESVAAFGAAGYQIDTGGGRSTVRGVRASGHFFDVLGVGPALGRLLTRADQSPGAARVVVLSHGFWQTHFGGRADAVGQTLHLSGQPHTVIGVLPDIWLPSWPVNPALIQLNPEHRQLWVPLPPESTLAQNTGAHVLGVIGRLAPNHTVWSAEQQLQSLVSPDQPDPHGGLVTPLRTQMVQQSRGPLWMLLAAAVCVLAIACLNLAAIDLASFETRMAEFRVRAALGAGATAFTRQLFSEAVPVVVMAGGLALGISRVILLAIEERLGARIPLMTPPRLDLTAVSLLAGLTVLVTLVMTAWPVLRARSLSRLRDQNTTRVTTANGPVFRLLIIGQLAGAVALTLTSTGLVHAFLDVGARDPGFDPTDVHIVELSLPRDQYRSPDVITTFERRLEERASSIPGAASVALSHDHPFEANWATVVTLRGDADRPADDARSQVQLRMVSPTYVDTMRARIVDGRGFDPRREAGDNGEVLVNEAFVRRESAAVGRQMTVSGPRATWGDAVPETFTIVGILEDERFRGLEADVEPAVYLSTRQFPQTDLTLLLRMHAGHRPASPDVRALFRSVEPGASIGAPLSLEQIEAEQRTPRTLTTVIISGFASGALVLAALGLYGTLSLQVGCRQRDTGIRMALGASPSQIRRQVVLDGLVPVVVGAVCGVGLTVLLNAGVSAYLLGAGLSDRVAIAVVAVVIMLVTVCASYGPARRAGRTDPTQLLR